MFQHHDAALFVASSPQPPLHPAGVPPRAIGMQVRPFEMPPSVPRTLPMPVTPRPGHFAGPLVPRLPVVSDSVLQALQPVPGREEICKYGQACQRAGCWYQHPNGRTIDQNPLKAMCHWGAACDKVDCWRIHPPERDDFVSPPQDFFLYLDEIAMNRPDVVAMPTDKEVFIDPLPFEKGTDELAQFLEAFGEVEEVFQLSLQARGYVRFKFHLGAARCVNAKAGIWSESERALKSDKAALGYSVQSSYPGSLILDIAGGVEAINIASLAETTGVRYLRLNAGGHSGYAKRVGAASDSRVHFSGKATRTQLEQLRLQVEGFIAKAHQTMARRLEALRPVELVVSGLPTKMLPAEVEELVRNFGAVESVEPVRAGEVVVTFESSSSAEKAAAGLRGECLGERSLECSLKPRARPAESAQHYVEDTADAAVVLVMNLHPGARADEIETLFAPIGPAKVHWPDPSTDAGSLRFCYVRLASADLAQQAVAALAGATLRGQGIQVSPTKPREDSATLFVANIPYEAQEANVQAALTPAGKVTDVRIVRNGRNCIAFVDFSRHEEATKAIQTLQGADCLGSPLRLDMEQERKKLLLLNRAPAPRGSQRAHRSHSPKKPQREPEPSKLFLGNVPAEATEEDLRGIFCDVDGLKEVAIVRNKADDHRANYAFVRYKTAAQAASALEKFRSLELFGKKVRVKQSGKDNDGWSNKKGHAAQASKGPLGKELVVRNLPDDAQEDELRLLFEPIGPLSEVKLLREEGGTHARLAYLEATDAATAMERLHWADFRGSSLKVFRPRSQSPSRKPKRRRPHLFVGNLPAELDEDVLRETMEGAGEVHEVRLVREKGGKFKGCAFVEYADPSCVDEAIQLLNHAMCLDRPMNVKRYRSRSPSPSARNRSRSRSPKVLEPPEGVWRPPVTVPPHLLAPPPPMMPLPLPPPLFLPPPRPTSATGPSTPRPSVRPSCAAHIRDQVPRPPRSRSRTRLPLARRPQETPGQAWT
ncbi:pabpc1-a [Symbiodinium natans]|uniref:Pabpc1-a protein n=1 Tax=Symbiodinium natans TaxID=878477 RepID=A0A812S8D0_9DINO|nr:pabpc1-a [Symbiodinium natans]